MKTVHQAHTLMKLASSAFHVLLAHSIIQNKESVLNAQADHLWMKRLMFVKNAPMAPFTTPPWKCATSLPVLQASTIAWARKSVEKYWIALLVNISILSPRHVNRIRLANGMKHWTKQPINASLCLLAPKTSTIAKLLVSASQLAFWHPPMPRTWSMRITSASIRNSTMLGNWQTLMQRIVLREILTTIEMPKFVLLAPMIVLTLICIPAYARTVATPATMLQKDSAISEKWTWILRWKG